jgi:heme/copper-type cytochrome/quinol oxidase subunit 2
LVQSYARSFAPKLLALVGLIIFFFSVPFAFAQSSQVEMEWALFNQILIIGIIVGLVVFGLMFYAIIRFREKPHEAGAK